MRPRLLGSRPRLPEHRAEQNPGLPQALFEADPGAEQVEGIVILAQLRLALAQAPQNRRGPFPQDTADGGEDPGLAPRHGDEVVDVPRGEGPGPVPDLLRQNLRGALHRPVAAEQPHRRDRLRRDMGAGDEIHLALQEVKLEEAGLLVIVGG